MNTNFHRYCLDSSTYIAVLSEKQFHAWKKHVSTTIKTRPSPHNLRFLKGSKQSSGSFIARIHIPQSTFLVFKTYIVRIDVSILTSLSVVYEFGLCIDFEYNSPKSNKQQWKITSIFKTDMITFSTPQPLSLSVTQKKNYSKYTIISCISQPEISTTS